MVIGLCDRWHKLPAEIEAMDTGALRLLAILKRGKGEEEMADGE